VKKILIFVGIGVVVILAFALIIYLSGSKERSMNDFFAAVRSGDVDTVKKLFKKKEIAVKTMDINNQTPLTIAAAQGNIEMAEFLISQKADINSTDGRLKFPVLMFAVVGDHVEMVKFLIDRGADVNAVADVSRDTRFKNGTTALMMAVAKGNEKIVEILILKKAEVK
jgi:ankyrin repeat protein